MDAAILAIGGVLLSAALAGVGWSVKQIISHGTTLAALSALQESYRADQLRDRESVDRRLAQIEKSLDGISEKLNRLLGRREREDGTA